MSEWKEYRLFDIINIIGGGTPKTSISEYWNGDIPWLSVVDFNTGKKYVHETDKSITNLGLEKSSTKLLDKDDIIISARGTVGVIAMLGRQMAFNQSCYGIKARAEYSNNEYIYYLLKDTVANFLQIAHGGVFDTITRDTFKEIDVNLPPLPEQAAIASILSSLDDKIDLLHRQNETLEKMAETLFRQWFAEETEEEWEEIKITDLFEIRDGTHDSPKPKEFGKKLVTSRHLYKHYVDLENAYYISDEDFEQINKRSAVETYDILFSMIGTIGNTYLEQSKKIDYAIKNIGLFKTSQNYTWKFFTYLWLLSDFGKEFIFENKSGSTQEYISLGALRSITFLVPDDNQIKLFNNLVRPLFKKINQNQSQIRTLTQLRDTLLPKLMNGNVRVI
ncbi:MAG: hypothetical protein GX128_11175 [Bacteroidales bacterium]|jgi:type I restriction enzyme S subunit|nr:hypothetical protein [Bacteroidales bacterium]